MSAAERAELEAELAEMDDLDELEAELAAEEAVTQEQAAPAPAPAVTTTNDGGGSEAAQLTEAVERFRALEAQKAATMAQAQSAMQGMIRMTRCC